MYYYFHHFYLKIEPKRYLASQILNTNHPFVFIGGSGIAMDIDASRRGYNSGGSYPWPGTYHGIGKWGQNDFVSGSALPIVEYTTFTQDSTIDGPNDNQYLELLKEPDYWRSIGFFETHKEYSWVGSNLYYGEPKNQFIKKILLPTYLFGMWAPTGPSKHLGWKINGYSAAFKRWA